MKRNTFIILIIFVVIVDVVIFIFCNSIEEQEESADKSEGILSYIVEIMEIKDDPAKVQEVHRIVRKIAHGLEFTGLGILLAMFFRMFEKKNRRKYICFPLLIGLLVGIADEFIQSFNDRSSEVADVLIDFGGIVVGLTVTMLAFACIDKRRKRVLARNYYEEKDCDSE